MARIFFALVTSVFLPFTAWAADQEVVTLEEAVRLAIERYPEVGKARASSDAMKGKVREVRAQALPEITLGSNMLRWRDPSLLNSSGFDKFPPEFTSALVPVPTNLFNYSISVKQPLYTAGKVGTALRLAAVEQEASLTDIDRAEQDLALAVVKAYWGLYWAERYKSVVTETQNQKKLHAEMARTRFKHGVATEVDVLRSEVAVANGQPDLVRAENMIRQARARLNQYLFRPIDYPTQVTGEFEDKKWEEWESEPLSLEAMRRRPEMTRARQAERSAALQVDLAKAESRLRLDFSSNYGLMAREPKNLVDNKYSAWSAGVNLQLPVFDGFRRSGLVYQASAAQRTARLDREQLELQVRLSIQQGLDDLKAAGETVAAARANIQQAEKVLAMMQNNYKWGAATTLDIVDAQTAVSVARTNLLLGLHDYLVARATLRWAIGRTPWE